MMLEKDFTLKELLELFPDIKHRNNLRSWAQLWSPSICRKTAPAPPPAALERTAALVHILVLFSGFCFGDKVLLCSPDRPGIHYVDQPGFRFSAVVPPAFLPNSYSRVCTTTPCFRWVHSAGQKCLAVSSVINVYSSFHFVSFPNILELKTLEFLMLGENMLKSLASCNFLTEAFI